VRGLGFGPRGDNCCGRRSPQGNLSLWGKVMEWVSIGMTDR
jgi:hypothetical protein